MRLILDEAVAHNDWARAAQARERIERISDELLRLVGFGAANKRAGSAGERARINVTRAIATSIRRINSDHRVLGSYFERTIRTGTFCTYAPDPRADLEWVL